MKETVSKGENNYGQSSTNNEIEGFHLDKFEIEYSYSESNSLVLVYLNLTTPTGI